MGRVDQVQPRRLSFSVQEEAFHLQPVSIRAATPMREDTYAWIVFEPFHSIRFIESRKGDSELRKCSGKDLQEVFVLREDD